MNPDMLDYIEGKYVILVDQSLGGSFDNLMSAINVMAEVG